MDGPSAVLSGSSARALDLPVRDHVQAARAYAHPLCGWGGPGGWVVLDEPELRLGPDIVTPGLAGWGREVMPHIPRGPFITVAPSWVADGPSLGHRRHDSLALYARHGVEYVWWIDASSRTLEVLQRHGVAWDVLSVECGNDVVRVEPFDTLELPLALLWSAR